LTVSEQPAIAATRIAYEVGRLRRAVRTLWMLPPVIAIAALFSHHGSLALIVGAGLSLLWLLLWWRSTPLGEAAMAGLLAGLPPLILPLLVGVSEHTCRECGDGSRWPLCMAACIAGGLIAGALVGVPAARRDRGRLSFLGVAALFTAAVGSLGCIMAGGIGVAGMVAGFVAGTAVIVIPSRVQGGTP
jgi:hypothetical protein